MQEALQKARQGCRNFAMHCEKFRKDCENFARIAKISQPKRKFRNPYENFSMHSFSLS